MSILERLLGRRVVAVWEGVTFRAGDRVVSRHSDETTLKPEETGRRMEVLLGDGKTGTVVRASSQKKLWLYVRWDVQKWQEAGKRRRGVETGAFVDLPVIRSSLHVDYVRPAPRSQAT